MSLTETRLTRTTAATGGGDRRRRRARSPPARGGRGSCASSCGRPATLRARSARPSRGRRGVGARTVRPAGVLVALRGDRSGSRSESCSAGWSGWWRARSRRAAAHASRAVPVRRARRTTSTCALAHERVVAGQSVTGEIVDPQPRPPHGAARPHRHPGRRRARRVRRAAAAPGAHGVAAARHPDLRRGIIRSGPATTVRSDPLGLLRREHAFEDVHELYVHPRTMTVPVHERGTHPRPRGQPDPPARRRRHVVPRDPRVRAGRLAPPDPLEVDREDRAARWSASTRSRGARAWRSCSPRREGEYADADEFELAVSCAASLGLRAVRDARDLDIVVGSEIPRVVRGRLRAIRHLPAVSPRALLDGFSGVDSSRTRCPSRMCAASPPRRTTGSRSPSIVVGSTVSLTRLRQAALGVPRRHGRRRGRSCDERAHPRIQTARRAHRADRRHARRPLRASCCGERRRDAGVAPRRSRRGATRRPGRRRLAVRRRHGRDRGRGRRRGRSTAPGGSCSSSASPRSSPRGIAVAVAPATLGRRADGGGRRRRLPARRRPARGAVATRRRPRTCCADLGDLLAGAVLAMEGPPHRRSAGRDVPQPAGARARGLPRRHLRRARAVVARRPRGARGRLRSASPWCRSACSSAAPPTSAPLRSGSVRLFAPRRDGDRRRRTRRDAAVAGMARRDERVRALERAAASSGVRISAGPPRPTAAARRSAPGCSSVAVVAVTAIVPFAARGADRTVLRSASAPRSTSPPRSSPLSTYRACSRRRAPTRCSSRCRPRRALRRACASRRSTATTARSSAPAAPTRSDQAQFVRVPAALDAGAGEPLRVRVAIDSARRDLDADGRPGRLGRVRRRPRGRPRRRLLLQRAAAAGVQTAGGGLAAGDAYVVSRRRARRVPTSRRSTPPGVRPARSPRRRASRPGSRSTRTGSGGAALEGLVALLRERGYLSHALSMGETPARWTQELPATPSSRARPGTRSRGSTRCSRSLLGAGDRSAGRGIRPTTSRRSATTSSSASRSRSSPQELGFPARVVVGVRLSSPDATLPTCADGTCRAQDLAAWTEVQNANGAWVPIDVDAAVREPAAPRRLGAARPRERHRGAPRDGRRGAARRTRCSRTPRPTQSRRTTSGADLAWLWPTLRIAGIALLLGTLAFGPFLAVIAAKAARRRGRRGAHLPADRIAGGWDEYVDAAIDAGRDGPASLTRTERRRGLRHGIRRAARVRRRSGRVLGGAGDRRRRRRLLAHRRRGATRPSRGAGILARAPRDRIVEIVRPTSGARHRSPGSHR